MELITSNKGGLKMCFKGYMYTKQHLCKTKIWWRCVKKSSIRCRASLTTTVNHKKPTVVKPHNHTADESQVQKAKLRSLKRQVAAAHRGSAAPVVAPPVVAPPVVAPPVVAPPVVEPPAEEPPAEIPSPNISNNLEPDLSYNPAPIITSPPIVKIENVKSEPRSSDEKNHLFLIDTDPGLDDAQAILMALGVDSVNVLALTTVQGNSPSYCSCLNALRLLKAADRLDIPVFPGCERPMISEPLHAGLYHGTDGFGDVPDKDAPGLDMAQSEHAVNSLIRLTREHPGEITLVALGPLTNIAMAIRMEPSLGTRLKNCFIMGGNYRGIGNITRSAEFNFANDPEAAQIVLTELKCPITLCTWELCTDMQQPLALWEKLMSMPGKKAAFMNKIQSVVKSRLEISGCYIMCDELAMAAAIDERTILESQDVFAEVETHGKIARGQLISDWRNLMAKPENVRIVTKMDMDRVEELLVNSFNS